MENNNQLPRHWIGPEELNQNYWNDPKVLEKRAQEFHDKPIETLEAIEKADKDGIARRDFLTLMGASMAMAGFACARRPVNKIIPYVVQPEEITPGVSTFYASTDPDTGYGLVVKTREGRPIKIDGNPDHPLNRGATTAAVQATLLDLYDPERLKGPMFRNRGSVDAKKVGWTEADTVIQSKLRSTARVRVLSRPLVGESTRRLIREFLTPYGTNGKHVEWSATSLDSVYRGQEFSYGTSVFPHYRFEKADVVVSVGADFLGTWPDSLAHAQGFMKRRKLSSKNAAAAKMSKLFCFEAMMTSTGASADERLPIRAGDEYKVLAAIAHELIVRGKKSRYAGDSSVTSALNAYSADAVMSDVAGDLKEQGVALIRQVADALWNARGEGIVITGSPQSRSRNAIAAQVVANLLNSACDNEGATVDGTSYVSSYDYNGFSDVKELASEMSKGLVDVLIVYRSNPVFTLPASLGFKDALKKVPLVIAVSDQADETTQFADYILPDHHALENWGDARPRKNLYSIQQPTISPMYDTRAFQDSLLTWIKGAGLSSSGLAGRVALASSGSNTWHSYVQLNWKESLYNTYNPPSTFTQFWESALRQGVFDGYAASGNASPKGSARGFKVDSLTKLPRELTKGEGVSLALYGSAALGDGTQANNAWLQELPDGISTLTWDNALNVSPKMAAKLSLKTHDVVEVEANGVKVELPVLVQPGHHADSVSVAFGYGRTKVGKVGEKAGTDVFPLAQVVEGVLCYSGISVKLRPTGRRFRLAETQWHHASENRPIINDITLAQFKKDPESANHTDPHLRMKEVPSLWPRHEYKGNKWGMAIDLSSCIGCGACIIGCQAENNIPIVGRDNVRVSREMHWIRIDRYYSGTPDNPDVVFQPMLCQHCENAPCETVCPVLATVHSEDGMNEQIYNRCVGTRYCQNNCPYKVRRFNFFDHWKQYEGSKNLAWNPDVTVRSRGIMEKCTFCVQRIREARHFAKINGTKIADGSLQTACQQACPTDGIVFGDLNDADSKVSKLADEKHAFRVLEVLNTRPSVHYLSKVRNKAAPKGDHA